jgi:methyl-accepting chemotaxis protein
MVILVMVASAIVVSMVINKQNKRLSYQGIEKSLDIIREELTLMQGKLISDTRQLGSVNQMGSTLKFISDFENNAQMIIEPLRKMAVDISQIGRTGKLWKAAIYDMKGDLKAFSIQEKVDEQLIGFTVDSSKGAFKGAVQKEDKDLNLEDWQDMPDFKEETVHAEFGKSFPKNETARFQEIGNALCMVALVPILAQAHDQKTGKPVQKQFGFAMGIRKLDQAFARRISKLSAMKINLFTGKGFIIGDLKDYKSVNAAVMKKVSKEWHLKTAEIILNDIELKDGKYFQGVLPLYKDTDLVGAIAALQSSDIVKANTTQMIKLLGLVYFICLLVIVPCAFFFSVSLTRPITKIIKTLTSTSQNVSAASDQFSASSIELAEGSSEQAASLEETSSSLEEMSATTQRNVESANIADGITNETNKVVEKANESMKLLTASMEDISKASEETSKIVKTIDEIAFQTNMLALNAAVEAARAGEGGAGFAVVADEVRNLAMRAAEAAGNTAELIDDTVKKVSGGAALVSETGEAFSEVSERARKIGQLIGEIASATNEQATGIDQINTVINAIDKIIQQNAASAEESASASQELNTEANHMKDVVRDLVALVGGSPALKRDEHISLDENPEKTFSPVRNQNPSQLDDPGQKAAAPKDKIEVRPEQIIPMNEEEGFEDF